MMHVLPELGICIVCKGNKGTEDGKPKDDNVDIPQEGKGGIAFQQRKHYAGAEKCGGGLAESVRICNGLVAKHYYCADQHQAFFYYYGNEHVLGNKAAGEKADGNYQQRKLIRQRVQNFSQIGYTVVLSGDGAIQNICEHGQCKGGYTGVVVILCKKVCKNACCNYSYGCKNVWNVFHYASQNKLAT